jgi:hypothetical protein
VPPGTPFSDAPQVPEPGALAREDELRRRNAAQAERDDAADARED